ncbi:BspA family leucine-rich repeat surface protein [Ruminococcus albus]|uniref:BspA family leucine-rich repeat surface protein n=1 Tax=Ruminococcus albus TaxID=1264 RepID=UPI00046721A1|nr:BspA family leucine-rich repeat surface protein [Ruminococcus albus]
MKMKKVLAVVMAFCMTAGAVSYGAPVITQSITAQAADLETDCYYFDEATGALTLRGTVERYTLRDFSSNYKDTVKSVVAEKDTILPEDSSELFYNYTNCVSIDLSCADTSSVKDMRFMFLGCSVMTELDLSGFDTSNVTDMRGMFGGCTSLTSLDVSSFDTGKVTDMIDMFFSCSKLTTLDVSRFDTSNVKSMHWMFGKCSGLTSIDVSGFDTNKVSDMRTMFYDCSGLTTLDLSSFDTSNVTRIGNMFELCSGLKELTLGEKFSGIPKGAELPNGDGWVNANAPTTVISGDGEYAVITNNGKNTYKRCTANTPTYPTNIKVEYSKEYHQVRFTWDKVEGADRYGIAVYLAGKWRVQAQNITGTVYTSPKNLTPGKTYKVAIAAKVNGKWDTANAIKNAVTVTVKGNSYVKPDIELKYSWDLYVIADEITMYLGPDTSYGKVTTIPRKTVLDELGIMNDNDNWAFTKYNGQYGWVQMVNEKGIMEVQIWGPVAAKPVIYLYPEKETDVHVEVELTEAELYTTYPKYNNGWDVVAKPDGSLVNKVDGTHHRYLFWDAVNCRTEFDLSKGFCVAGSDTESFLKEKLSYMGLTEDEMNEFIVYWLPKMEHNKYNLISFQSDKYTDSAKLNITPTPDSMLRIFMTYVPLEEAVEIDPQELSTFERSGFTVVEWGGSEL